MKSFVDIIPLYENEEERIVETLSAIYDDKDVLYDSIKSLIIRHIDVSDIKDKKVLLKPNWVLHDTKPSDKISLCTHENFILSTLKVVLKLKPKSVLIGDAPIQRCNWDLLLSKSFYRDWMC